jgi:hypothetical protein
MSKQIKSIKDLPPDFKIIHVLPDGREVDSIKGMIIPYMPETKNIYELIAKYSQEGGNR